MRKSDDEMSQRNDDSTAIFKSNIIEQYCDRPNPTFMNGKFAAVSNICLAESAAYYYKDYHSKGETDGSNDCQLEVLTDDVMQSEPGSDEHVNHYLPHTVRLMSKNETLKCRKVKLC